MRTERSGPATRSSTMVGMNSDLRVAWAGMLDYKMAWQPADQDVTMSQTEQSPELAGVMKADERRLAEAIGAQMREFRKQLDVTMAEVAHLAGLSVGMLSKIERGVSSPSLSTLTSVAAALNVPVTAFFRRYEEQRDCAYVQAGEGLVIERAGTRAGHEYRLLGHSIRSHLTVEPYLITLTDKSEVFPLFQHTGVEFLYILAGEVLYRHGRGTYRLKAGDSLFFDAEAAHGPEELISLPVKMIAVLSRAKDAD